MVDAPLNPHPDFEVLAEHLEHPEGPDTLENGDVVMVETWTGKIRKYRRGAGISDHAVTDGGANACVLGSDGCIYATQMLSSGESYPHTASSAN